MKMPISIYKFVVSGTIATCIDFVSYMLLRQIVWTSIAKTISMILANIWSYFINKRWVFAANRNTDSKMIGSYVVAQILNLGTNVGVNSLMLYMTGYVVIPFIIATLCAAIVNYSLQKLIVFK